MIAARASAWQTRHTASFQGGALEPGSPQAVEQISESGPAPLDELEHPSGEPTRAVQRGSAFARLLIGRLGVDVVVAEGTDKASLMLGPGHMEGSALPGESDNCIIAGHRDGPFGLLPTIRRGDEVEIRDRSGSDFYRVDSIRVVDKDNTAALATSREPILTLITCYPLDHVGPAPQRLIVRASLIENG
jgi:sortase A